MSTDIFSRAGVDNERDEQARRAVKAFRALQPTLTAYARVLTKRRDVRVEMAAKDNGSMDGKRIYYRPPLALGDKTPHERRLCDKRGDDLRLLCPACRVRESVLVVIYHEIGHFTGDSMAEVDEADKVEAIARAVKEAGGKYADQIAKRIESAPAYVKNSYIGTANLVSPFLGFIVNCLEDARVNRGVFNARKGTKVMFEADTYRILTEGVEQKDPSTGEVVVKKWRDYPLNMQVSIALFAKASGYEMRDEWFVQPVLDAMKDEELTALVRKMDTVRSVAGVYHLSFPVLARLRELGFFKSDNDPEPEPEVGEPDSDEDQQPEDQAQPESGSGDEEDSDESSPDEQGPDDEGAEGNPSDPADGSEAEDSGSGADGDGDADGDGESDAEPHAEGGSDEAAGEPSENGADCEGSDDPDDVDGGGEFGDAEPGSAERPDADADDASSAEGGGDESEDAPDREGDPAGSEAGDIDEGGEVDEDAGEGAGSPDDGDAEPDADDQGSGNDGQSAESSPEAGVNETGEGESESDASEESESSTGNSGAGAGDPGAEVDGEGSDEAGGDPGGQTGEHDASVEDGDGVDGQSDLGEGGPTGSADLDMDEKSESVDGADGDSGDTAPDGDDDLAAGDSEHDDSDDDADPLDTGADTGEGGTEVIENNEWDDLPMGTPEDCAKGLKEVFHPEDRPKHIEEMSPENTNAVDRAIIQGIYFETPSRNIYGVREHRWGEPIFAENAYGEQNMSQAWSHETYSSWGYNKRQQGIEGDFEPPESILGPALLRMRVAFSDNQRGKDLRNMKSGKVDGRVLGRRAFHNDERLFRKRITPGKKDYFVLIGMDVSGSTIGKNIQLEKRAVMAQAHLLSRMGIPFAIYAHSGNLHDPKSGRKYGLDLDIYIVKEPHEVWDAKVHERLQQLGPDAANLDGHTIEYYRKVLDGVTATDKIMLYYTDGKMPAENHDEELEILQRELKVCKQKGYTVLGVGIRTDSPVRHGLDTVQVDGDEDVVKVVKHLEKRLLAG